MECISLQLVDNGWHINVYIYLGTHCLYFYKMRNV